MSNQVIISSIEYLLQNVDEEFLHPVPGCKMANYCIELPYCCIPWYIVGDTEEEVVQEYNCLGVHDPDRGEMTLYHGDLIITNRQLISREIFINWPWLEMIGLETEPILSIDQVKNWLYKKYNKNLTDKTVGQMIIDGTFIDRDGRKREVIRIHIP